VNSYYLIIAVLVHQLDVAAIWKSDGTIEWLLAMVFEAGFLGDDGLELVAGMDLGKAKRESSEDLVVIGSMNLEVLCNSDLDGVRGKVRRCVVEGAHGGGYLGSSGTGIFENINPLR